MLVQLVQPHSGSVVLAAPIVTGSSTSSTSRTTASLTPGAAFSTRTCGSTASAAGPVLRGSRSSRCQRGRSVPRQPGGTAAGSAQAHCRPHSTHKRRLVGIQQTSKGGLGT